MGLMLQREAARPQLSGVAAINKLRASVHRGAAESSSGKSCPCLGCVPAGAAAQEGCLLGDAAEHAAALMMKGRSEEICAITGEGSLSSWAV